MICIADTEPNFKKFNLEIRHNLAPFQMKKYEELIGNFPIIKLCQ